MLPHRGAHTHRGGDIQCLRPHGHLARDHLHRMGRTRQAGQRITRGKHDKSRGSHRGNRQPHHGRTHHASRGRSPTRGGDRQDGKRNCHQVANLVYQVAELSQPARQSGVPHLDVLRRTGSARKNRERRHFERRAWTTDPVNGPRSRPGGDSASQRHWRLPNEPHRHLHSEGRLGEREDSRRKVLESTGGPGRRQSRHPGPRKHSQGPLGRARVHDTLRRNTNGQGGLQHMAHGVQGPRKQPPVGRRNHHSQLRRSPDWPGESEGGGLQAYTHLHPAGLHEADNHQPRVGQRVLLQ